MANWKGKVMEYDIFKEIKARLSMPDLVQGYGIEINRRGYCLCPFHAEKTPSMHIMEKGYYCFGCGEGGDHIKFVQKLFNLENPLDAAKKINEDFGLGLDPNHKPTKEEFISARKIVTERQEFEREENIAFNAFSDYFKILRDYGRIYAPQSESEILDKRFIEYLHNFERIDYTVNRMIELMHNPMNERKEFLKDNEDYLVTVAERLLEIRRDNRQQENEIQTEQTQISNSSHKESPVHKTIVINAFGGPGAGKTTACLDITSMLRKRGFVAEYVPEYAKELVWDKNFEMLDGSEKNQKNILKEQQKRMDRLMGKVDFIVTDAPLLLNTIYLNSPDKTAYTKEILDRFNKYDNFCFVVERNTAVFEQEGRIQNLEQSIEKDNDITKLLKDNNIYFKTYNHESLNKVAENAIRTHQRITGIKKETPIGERIQSAKAVGDIIGNTPYKAISDKSYLKYSNAIASQIADKLQQNNVAFSGRVYSNLTTFTVNKKDLDKLRSIAENLTRSFTDRHRPQLIPSFKQQKTIQKQMTAAPRQQSCNKFTL